MSAPESSPNADEANVETPDERADRNFIELLQGFRVAVTGVQVLFAFLLVVPFSTEFGKVDDFGRSLLYVALVSSAIASICYIAPAAQHRVLFRQGLKEPLVHRSNRLGLAGGVALLIAMVSATLMVVDHLFGGLVPMLTAGTLAALATWLWFVQPSIHRFNGT
ncbi:DUF6328 family protein [Micromonospora sp. CPCC 206061]|uniref:DUF6328 family protein n=1 Tax=Micromonospora sp. CPCC 206061 TaxID=3122410 RepID=UPI002FF05A93